MSFLPFNYRQNWRLLHSKYRRSSAVCSSSSVPEITTGSIGSWARSLATAIIILSFPFYTYQSLAERMVTLLDVVVVVVVVVVTGQVLEQSPEGGPTGS
jgi:hypothetical protein